MKVLMHHSQRAARSFVRGLENRLKSLVSLEVRQKYIMCFLTTSKKFSIWGEESANFGSKTFETKMAAKHFDFFAKAWSLSF
jgi:DNA polymerase elongation subunit (family B)